MPYKACTPRLDSDTSALSLRLEKLENRLDKLCDGEISIQPRAAVQTVESTEKHISAQSAKPVSVAGDRPQDIIANTLNRIENKATSADDKQKDVTAPVQLSGTDRNATDSKPDWLFEGTGGADDNASAVNEDVPPFDLDEPQASIAPQERASKTGGDGDKPDWLFEGTGGADDNASAVNEDAPPFDIDEPQVSVAPQEQAVKTENNLPGQHKNNLSAGSVQSTGNADPQVTEILDRLPVILQAILGQVQVTLGRDTVNISGYQKFQYDFLTTGDSKERLEKAAEEVTGRRLVMTFDNNGDTAESKDKSDPVSDFLSRAEKMGVKIKYKKPKN